MVTYSTPEHTAELEGILALQKANLKSGLAEGEIESQGFVTVSHSLETLNNLNQIEKHIIAKEGDKVVAYVLSMTRQSRLAIPVLIPMFEVFDRIEYKGKLISSYNYLVVGQVCVDKSYRGSGVFGACYAKYRQHYAGKYDFAITEIAKSNLRSLQAHKSIGFEEIHAYADPAHRDWVVVLWDWKKAGNKV